MSDIDTPTAPTALPAPVAAKTRRKLVNYITGKEYKGRAPLMSRREVASVLGRSLPHVSNQVKAGKLTPAAYDPKTQAWFFRKNHIDTYIRKGGK